MFVSEFTVSVLVKVGGKRAATSLMAVMPEQSVCAQNQLEPRSRPCTRVLESSCFQTRDQNPGLFPLPPA